MLSACMSRVNENGKEIVRHGDLRLPAACYRDVLSRDVVPWHWHEEWEVLIMERGCAALGIEGEEVFLKEGEGAFINKEVLHSVRDAGGTDAVLRSIVFHPRLIGAGAESIFWQSLVLPVEENRHLRLVILHPDIPWEHAVLSDILAAWRAGTEEPEGFYLAMRDHLSRAALEILSHEKKSVSLPDAGSLRAEKRIKRMLSYIRDHLGDPLTTADLARSASVSESECLRCFKSRLGTTPMQCVREMRIQQAAELLAGSELKVSEIGGRCGFQEMSYFTKIFKREKGLTPSAFRRENKKAEV